MPSEGGSCLVRACEKRCITHKASARKKIIDRFGAYLSHLISHDGGCEVCGQAEDEGLFFKYCSVVPSFMTYFNHQ